MNVLYRRPAAFAALAFLCLFSAGTSGPPSFDVPLNDPVYGYIGLLPLAARVHDIDLSSRPFTEAQVCTLLVYAEKEGICTDSSINRFYLRRFSRSPGGCSDRARPPTFRLDDCRSIAYPYAVTSFSVQDSNFSRAGFNATGADSISNGRELYNATRVGGRLYMSLWSALLQFDGAIATEYSTLREWEKTDDPRTGVNLTTIMAKKYQPGHFIGYDDFTASLHLPLPWLDVKVGNDRVSWGYADSSGLLFSGAGAPFQQVKIDKTFGTLNYSFLVGRLIGDTYEQRRVVYAKHITYTPRRWISLGLSDAVISVNRDFEPLYCMPFVPFYFMEHYLGDLDNRVMSFDFMTLARGRASAYGELVIDDISNLTGFFTNKTWGDKWGGLFGVKVFRVLPFAPVSALRAEVVQIEPWVYTTSARPDNTDNNYPVNFGRTLGNQMGPHSRSVSLDLSCLLTRTVGASLSVAQFWKGTGPGSDIFERNPFPDTVNGRIIDQFKYETKEYRFKNFSRDRTVVQGQMFTYAKEWLRFDLNAALAFEQEPRETSLYQVGVRMQVNY